MVKRCAWGTCNSDSRYPERLFNKEGQGVKSYSFPSLKKNEEHLGYGRAVVAINLFAQKIVMCVEYILLEITDQLKTIPIQYQQQQAEQRFDMPHSKQLVCIFLLHS